MYRTSEAHPGNQYRFGVPMKVLIDAIPITGASTAIVTEHLLRAWADLGTDDEIHVVTRPHPCFDIPPSVHVHRIAGERFGLAHRLWTQTVTIPRLSRQLQADIVLGLIASTTIAPLPCPRGIVVHDMRHELRPEQFLRRTIFFREISYRLGYRQSTAIACISERTRRDLLATHPELEQTLVGVMPLGSDHTARWPERRLGPPYAIAFGQYANKNIELVLKAWAKLVGRDEALPLRIVGVPEDARGRTAESIARLGLGDLVTILPWMPDSDHHAAFTSASLIVFPSDFEGFGLPAVEAMALGIPLVVSEDAALREVTGGYAVTMTEPYADELADAVVQARAQTPAELRAARDYAAGFTWSRSAAAMRDLLAQAIAGSAPAPAPVDETMRAAV
jgi:glycosyltransferase involved in cell wall biosynthesis